MRSDTMRRAALNKDAACEVVVVAFIMMPSPFWQLVRLLSDYTVCLRS